MNRPTLALAVAVNRSVRAPDEWFDEPDDLERVAKALRSIQEIDHPVVAAGTLAFRVAHAQGFGEGNKRTALLLARWVLDRNGVSGAVVLPQADRAFAALLVKAARGFDVEHEMLALLHSRV